MISLKTNINDVLAPISAKIEALKPGGAIYDTALRTVATTMLGSVRTRIHEQGKAADGSDIGTYSKNPIYVSARANPGKSFGRPIGKTGRSKFAGGAKAGQDHKSRYFAGGYDEYKTAIGRNQLGKVNLSLSGQLNNQLNVTATDKGFGLGWPDAEKLKRAGYLEAKYKKKIWALTEDEKKLAAEVAENVIGRALSE